MKEQVEKVLANGSVACIEDMIKWIILLGVLELCTKCRY